MSKDTKIQPRKNRPVEKTITVSKRVREMTATEVFLESPPVPEMDIPALADASSEGEVCIPSSESR